MSVLKESTVSSSRTEPWQRAPRARVDARPPRVVPWWYMVARSDELRAGDVRRVEIGDEAVVLFRARGSGRLNALPAYCQHQGVDLSRAEVVGDHLRCPLHHWLYSDRCEAIPGRTDVPDELNRRHYAAMEQSGMIFVHLGAMPRAPLPRFATVDSATLYFRAARRVTLECPWYVPVLNAFDMTHLGTVHQRRLTSAPEIAQPDPMSFLVRYTSAVTGHEWSDRAMRRLSGDEIRNVITCSGGTTILVEAEVGRRRSFLMVSLRPVADRVEIHPVVGVARRRFGLHVVHALAAQALFTAFLERDMKALNGIRFIPRFDDARDETLDACYQFLCSLPEHKRPGSG